MRMLWSRDLIRGCSAGMESYKKVNTFVTHQSSFVAGLQKAGLQNRLNLEDIHNYDNLDTSSQIPRNDANSLIL